MTDEQVKEQVKELLTASTVYLTKLKTATREMHELRQLVWGLDIPSPTVPEYVEFHEGIQKILNKIDSMEVLK